MPTPEQIQGIIHASNIEYRQRHPLQVASEARTHIRDAHTKLTDNILPLVAVVPGCMLSTVEMRGEPDLSFEPTVVLQGGGGPITKNVEITYGQAWGSEAFVAQEVTHTRSKNAHEVKNGKRITIPAGQPLEKIAQSLLSIVGTTFELTTEKRDELDQAMQHIVEARQVAAR